MMRWFNGPFGERYCLRESDDPYRWMENMERRMMPHWLNNSLASAQNLGNAIGEVRAYPHLYQDIF